MAAPGVLIAAVLTLPDLRLRYFWDDYWFLARAQIPSLASLLPSGDTFYRPISRVLYFWPLAPLGTDGAPLAHAINWILVLLSVALLATFVARVWGGKAGVLAGAAYASAWALPCLVGWASASQDLLSILFVLAAFHLRLSGRVIGSGIAFAAALLSKETAAVLAPAIVFLDWIVGVKPGRTRLATAVFGSILVGWFALHSGIHQLLAGHLTVEPRHYVGYSNLALAEFHARRYLAALFNFPQSGIPAWTPVWIGGALLVAIATGIGLIFSREDDRRSLWRGVVLALLIAVPTLLLPAFLLSTWAGYLLCFPMIGAAILLGVLLSRMPAPVASVLIALFAFLGLAARATPNPYGDTVSERAFFDSSRAIHEVQEAFHRLRPTFPRASQLVVSVAASGPLGIDGTMHDGQAPRIWYRDPTLRVVRPERRRRSLHSEYLFRVDGPDVWEIDPDSLAVRTSGGSPDSVEVRAVIRTYARGLSASGENARATRILRRLAGNDPKDMASYDLRLATMGALAARDTTLATGLLLDAGPITREVALFGLAKVMAEPTGRADYDSTAYFAFGVSSTDQDALRYLMNMFYASLLVPQARHFAQRLHTLAPADSESAEILSRLGPGDASETPLKR